MFFFKKITFSNTVLDTRLLTLYWFFFFFHEVGKINGKLSRTSAIDAYRNALSPTPSNIILLLLLFRSSLLGRYYWRRLQLDCCTIFFFYFTLVTLLLFTFFTAPRAISFRPIERDKHPRDTHYR